MKNIKILILFLCAAVLVAASVFGTLAYLTSRDSVANTFTVGQVSITLDEAKVNPDGTPVEGADRVKENAYHLLPGMTYTKDPTLTVKAGSEDSYVRMLVTINCLKELDALFAPDGADLTALFNGYDPETWIYETEVRDTENNTVTYEFRYKETVTKSSADTVLDALFTSITVPGSFSGDDMKTIADLEITVVGHAIQTVGFADADAAWAAFNEQING